MVDFAEVFSVDVGFNGEKTGNKARVLVHHKLHVVPLTDVDHFKAC